LPDKDRTLIEVPLTNIELVNCRTPERFAFIGLDAIAAKPCPSVAGAAAVACFRRRKSGRHSTSRRAWAGERRTF
jgi:hypothetical protein